MVCARPITRSARRARPRVLEARALGVLEQRGASRAAHVAPEPRGASRAAHVALEPRGASRTAHVALEQRGARLSGPGGADGLRVPATRVLPGHVLAAPPVRKDMFLSLRLSRRSCTAVGRLRASPGSSRCFPRRRPLPPGPTSSAPRLSPRPRVRATEQPSPAASTRPGSTRSAHTSSVATAPASATSGAHTVPARGVGPTGGGSRWRGPMARAQPPEPIVAVRTPRQEASASAGLDAYQAASTCHGEAPPSQGPAARRPPRPRHPRPAARRSRDRPSEPRGPSIARSALRAI